MTLALQCPTSHLQQTAVKRTGTKNTCFRPLQPKVRRVWIICTETFSSWMISIVFIQFNLGSIQFCPITQGRQVTCRVPLASRTLSLAEPQGVREQIYIVLPSDGSTFRSTASHTMKHGRWGYSSQHVREIKQVVRYCPRCLSKELVGSKAKQSNK